MLGAARKVDVPWSPVRTSLSLFLLLVLLTGCMHKIYDFYFRAESVVLDPDGRPISNVRVTVEIAKPVYRVIAPVRLAETYTDLQGRFAFEYISHESDPSYTLGFDKSGYQPVLIEGAIQAMNPHSVRLVPVAP